MKGRPKLIASARSSSSAASARSRSKSELRISGAGKTLRMAGETGGTSDLPNVPSGPGSRSSRKAIPISASAAAAAVNRASGSLSSQPWVSLFGREADRGPLRPDHVGDRPGRLDQQPDPVLDRAAIIVVAQIGAVAQELVDQIAIGGVELDPVEAGRDRIGGGPGIIVEQARYLVQPKRPRLGIRLPPLIGMGLVGRGGGGGGDGRLAAEEAGMDDPAHVPELAEDPPARLVHRLDDRLPRLPLLLGPDAGRIGPAEALAAHSGRLGDDQAGARALAIIFGHQLGRHMLAGGPAAGQRRHDDSVGAEHGAQLDRVEEGRHRHSLTGGSGDP